MDPLPISILTRCFHTSIGWIFNAHGIPRRRQLDSSRNQDSSNCRDPSCIWVSIKIIRTTPRPTGGTRIRWGRETWHPDPNKAELLRTAATHFTPRELCSASQASANRQRWPKWHSILPKPTTIDLYKLDWYEDSKVQNWVKPLTDASAKLHAATRHSEKTKTDRQRVASKLSYLGIRMNLSRMLQGHQTCASACLLRWFSVSPCWIAPHSRRNWLGLRGWARRVLKIVSTPSWAIQSSTKTRYERSLSRFPSDLKQRTPE